MLIKMISNKDDMAQQSDDDDRPSKNMMRDEHSLQKSLILIITLMSCQTLTYRLVCIYSVIAKYCNNVQSEPLLITKLFHTRMHDQHNSKICCSSEITFIFL